MRAPFVTFEGIEGSGKTTQLRLLSDHLDRKGIPHLVTREPGGTPLADEIRALLLCHREEIVHPETELLLYAAARAQHVRSVIRPALDAGRAVLCDRFCDATVAYQGFMRRLDAGRIEWLNAFASDGIVPDLTVYLDIDPELGLKRVGGRGAGRDRIESESAASHGMVREGYLRLAARHPERIVAVDGNRPEEAVFRDTLTAASRFGW